MSDATKTTPETTTIRVEKALHRRLKLLAVTRGATINDLIDKLLRPAVERLEQQDG